PLGTRMVPAPNGHVPAIARNSVDLPAPDGPVSSTRSPAAMAMSLATISAVPCGSRTRRSSISTRSLPSRAETTIAGVAVAAARDGARGRGGGGAPRPAPRMVEGAARREPPPPLRELAIGVDDKRQRALHAGERGGGLHQPAELNRSGKIGGTDHDEGKDDRD